MTRKNILILTFLILIALIGGFLIYWFLIRKKDDDKDTTSSTPEESVSLVATEGYSYSVKNEVEDDDSNIQLHINIMSVVRDIYITLVTEGFLNDEYYIAIDKEETCYYNQKKNIFGNQDTKPLQVSDKLVNAIGDLKNSLLSYMIEENDDVDVSLFKNVIVNRIASGINKTTLPNGKVEVKDNSVNITILPTKNIEWKYLWSIPLKKITGDYNTSKYDIEKSLKGDPSGTKPSVITITMETINSQSATLKDKVMEGLNELKALLSDDPDTFKANSSRVIELVSGIK